MKKILIIIAFMLIFSACGDNDSSENDSTDDKDLIEENEIEDISDGELVDILENDKDVEESQDDAVEYNDVPDDIGAMVEVPAGSFFMGCEQGVGKPYCENFEKPRHEVTLTVFNIDKYEVTVREYEECIEAGVCNNENEDEPHYILETDSPYKPNMSSTAKKDHPMNYVTWFGATAFCEWKGKKLPTEAQWEKAARGEESFYYPWGNEPIPDCEYAVITGSVDGKSPKYGCGKISTWTVGSREKGKSPYGAYDMAGNVAEWVSDWHSENYYENSPSENPTGPESGALHVVRGGGWMFFGDGNRFFTYSRSSPGNPVSGGATIGFRCVK